MPIAETSRTSRKNLKNIAKTVADEVTQELESQGHLPGELEIEEDPSTDEGEFDVFVQPAEEVIKSNGSPRFRVKKDGQFLKTVNHPYSWDQLQKEFGGGFFQVSCINQRGQVVKSQSQQVAPPQDEEDDSDFPLPSSFGAGAMVGDKKPSFMEMLTFMKTMNSDVESRVRDAAERARQEAKDAAEKADRDARNSSREQNTLFQTMLTLVQEGSKQSAANTLEMMRMMNESNNKMLEKLNAKIDSQSSKKDSIDQVSLLKLIQDAEDRGYNRRKDLDEMAEERVEERLAQINDQKSEDGESKDSALTSLIKGFMPVITQAVKAQSENPQVLQGQPSPAQIAAAQEARHAAQIHANAAQFRKEQELRNRNRPRNPAPVKTAVTQAPSKVVERDNLGLPKAPTSSPAASPTTGPSTKEKLNGHFKEHVFNQVLPIVAEYLTAQGDAGTNAENAALSCLKTLEGQGISRKDVLAGVKFEDIIEKAREAGLDQSVDPWFMVFWGVIIGENKSANVQAQTRNESQKLAQNSDGQAPGRGEG